MTIDRRAFVTGVALAAIAPSLEMLPGQIFTPEKDADRVVFRIDGWSTRDDGDASDQVWLRLGHSWRVAWR